MTDARKRLLIVYHTQSGNTGQLADAVLRGARRVAEVDTVIKRAFDAGTEDLLACDALLLGTPENFGYMSGALKDFFDRTYYPCEGRLEGLPYAVFVSAGNDGSGAVREIGRIAKGYGWKPAAEALIARKGIAAEDLARAEELGEGFATALSIGIL
ncbi:MAG: flavodoxin family protein [Thauera phenolivorans]|uniref:Flavodoxin family protein n=1 Tax=Thauera phenolivorans TaxID=1792543 RepID=A0A7X7R7I8_9RHOO|nr:NAD(P)H-dependent oxidoreductase [Thauera phenolivorans]NLF53353.1 flavodoxin family protein [Thauera phenolivorans]